MTSYAKPIVLFVTLLTLSAACSKQDTMDASNCQYNKISDPADYNNICGLYVKEGAITAHLEIRIGLETGSAEWTLRDPNEETRHTGTAQAGTLVEKEFTFENPIPGRWEIEFTFDDATGEYETPWTIK